MTRSTNSMSRKPYVFTGNPLDRAAILRKDRSWLANTYMDKTSRILPLCQLRPLVTLDETPKLSWQSLVELAGMVTPGSLVMLGVLDGRSYFSADFSIAMEANQMEFAIKGSQFEDARGIAASLSSGDAGILAQARSLVDWHLRNGFCSACGCSTEAFDGGYSRTCNSCGTQQFPRTDPVVIMLVCYGEECLLGRQSHFPKGVYSALAGFIEPGETIEDAVGREAYEESGIKIGNVFYHSSQPWPFPSSLMIGCIAEAVTTLIDIDQEELEDARWFSRAQVREGLNGASWDGNSDFRMPPPLAIAYQLARWWVDADDAFGGPSMESTRV